MRRAVVTLDRQANKRVGSCGLMPTLVLPRRRRPRTSGAPQQVFGREHHRRFTPGDRLAREQQRFREVRLHQVQIVQRREHRALLAVPAPYQVEQVGGGLGVDAR